MKITRKGQVTIPREIREHLDLRPGTEVDFVVDGEDLRIVRRYPRGEGQGAKIVGRIRGTGGVRMTTDEILALTRSY